MLLDVSLFLANIVSAAIVMGLAGLIAGHLLRLISQRFAGGRLAWLLGNLSLVEGFVFGLILMSVVVAAVQSWITSADMGAAWLRYAAGGCVALVALLTVFRFRKQELS